MLIFVEISKSPEWEILENEQNINSKTVRQVICPVLQFLNLRLAQI